MTRCGAPTKSGLQPALAQALATATKGCLSAMTDCTLALSTLGKSASLQALPLFAATVPRDEATSNSDEIATLCDALKQLNPDNMSPKQALEALYHLKMLVPGCADGTT